MLLWRSVSIRDNFSQFVDVCEVWYEVCNAGKNFRGKFLTDCRQQYSYERFFIFIELCDNMRSNTFSLISWVFLKYGTKVGQ
jgi:hypothetical protein